MLTLCLVYSILIDVYCALVIGSFIMKKFFRLCFAVAALITMFAFVSCSSEDENSSADNTEKDGTGTEKDSTDTKKDDTNDE